MADLVIRPSRRRMLLSLVLAAALAAVVVWLYLQYRDSLAWWVLLVALLPFAGPHAGWLDTRRMTMTVGGAAVRAEFGLWRKQVREIPLAAIASVTVERGIAQRLYGVGTLVVEGSASGQRIVTAEIDRPGWTARRIRDAARVAGAAAAVRDLADKESEEQ